jgi:hypothetical protein
MPLRRNPAIELLLSVAEVSKPILSLSDQSVPHCRSGFGFGDHTGLLMAFRWFKQTMADTCHSCSMFLTPENLAVTTPPDQCRRLSTLSVWLSLPLALATAQPSSDT